MDHYLRQQLSHMSPKVTSQTRTDFSFFKEKIAKRKIFAYIQEICQELFVIVSIKSHYAFSYKLNIFPFLKIERRKHIR